MVPCSETRGDLGATVHVLFGVCYAGESSDVFAEVRCSVVCCTRLAMCGSSVAPLLSFHSRCACSSSSALSLRRSAVFFPSLDLRGLCPSGSLRAMLVFGKVAVLLRCCRKGSSAGLPLCHLGSI